jgi:hypothetical protein
MTRAIENEIKGGINPDTRLTIKMRMQAPQASSNTISEKQRLSGISQLPW